MEGLPYELIINSNPSIAYLMRQNPLYLQILIMAHCVGHSDFFKNNRIFSHTRPDSVTSKFRNARKRIQKYTEDPSIGLKKVEMFLDDLHAVKFQMNRDNRRRLSREEVEKKIIRDYNNSKSKKSNRKLSRSPDLKKRLLEPDHDFLSFLIEYGTHFEDWQIDMIEIVRDESEYFVPQMKTKVLNEGWASFWHYKILNELEIPQEYHLPFIKSHNQVVRPHLGGINPYHIGFHLFKKIEEKEGLDECFLIREVHEDVSAIRMYLDHEDFRKLNLFSYSSKKDSKTIDEISDRDGWKKVREDLIRNIGDNPIPRMIVSDISSEGDLILKHMHDGRDLELEYADNVIGHIRNLWNKNVKFFTVIEEEMWEI
jgi:stage V sporulation protein R